MSNSKVLLGLIMSLAVAAGSAAASRQQAADYIVGQGDVLKITVYDEPTLSGSFTVDAEGAFTYPLLDRITVGGKTVRKIEEELTARLKAGYLRNPQVAVVVEQYRSQFVHVTGAVRLPGYYALKGPENILGALALAQGVTNDAANEALIVHPKDPNASAGKPADPQDTSNETERVNLRDIENGRLVAPLIRDGDHVFVPRASKFFVNGHVRQPGPYVLEPGMTVQTAIAMAGGLSERGSDRGIKIVRTVNGQQKEIDAKLSDAVQPGDMIKIRQRIF